MQLDWRSPPPKKCQNAIVAIGNFDGVHRGHLRLIGALLTRARELSAPAVAMTFDPHPIELLRPQHSPPRLTAPERRDELLLAAGVDAVVSLKTDMELLRLEPREFFQRVLVGAVCVRELIEGPNFRFGAGRAGGVDVLRQLGQEYGVPVSIVDIATTIEGPISSTRIRECLQVGAVGEASLLLGRPHRVHGDVVHGAHRGRDLGFPTANIVEAHEMMPAPGVYAAGAMIENIWRPVACHIGPKPTFEDERSILEAHIIGFHGDLYGASLAIDFFGRIRETERFGSLEALKRRLQADVQQAVHVFNSNPQPADWRRSERVRTIQEWVRQFIEPALAISVGRRLKQVDWVDGAEVRLTWEGTGPSAPSEVFEMLFGVEQRIREVFPEVRVVSSTMDADG